MSTTTHDIDRIEYSIDTDRFIIGSVNRAGAHHYVFFDPCDKSHLAALRFVHDAASRGLSGDGMSRESERE